MLDRQAAADAVREHLYYHEEETCSCGVGGLKRGHEFADHLADEMLRAATREHIVSDTEECWCEPVHVKVAGK